MKSPLRERFDVRDLKYKDFVDRGFVITGSAATVRDRLLEMGADPVENLYGPQFETFVKSEMVRYAKLVKDAGIKPE